MYEVWGLYHLGCDKVNIFTAKDKKKPRKNKQTALKRKGKKKKKKLICLSKEIKIDFKITEYEKMNMKKKFVCLQSD